MAPGVCGTALRSQHWPTVLRQQDIMNEFGLPSMLSDLLNQAGD